jgi:uncharacterized integral membrane protein
MKTRIIVFLILIVLFTIVVTQNTQAIIINFFFWQFSSPGILIIVITGVAGVLIGLILASIFRPVKKKNPHEVIPIPGDNSKA